MQHGQYSRTDGGPAGGVYPHFYIEAVEDPIASAQNGRPIFREVERVEIIIPGDPTKRPVKPVGDAERQRWPQEYDAFRRGMETPLVGTPLNEWARLSVGKVAELQALGFRTVEDVAAASDTVLMQIGRGGFGLRTAAQDWLADADAGKLTTALTAENEQLRLEISNLQRQVDEQGNLLRQVHAEMTARSNALPALETMTMAQSDPLSGVERREAPASSALDDFDTPRRGRPRKQDAA